MRLSVEELGLLVQLSPSRHFGLQVETTMLMAMMKMRFREGLGYDWEELKH